MSLDSMTILIAGPLASNADVVRDAIDGTGAMIERDGAGDHGAILRILEGRRVDCAVIDLAVAAAEGGALVPTLRARGIDTPILLVSDGSGADRDDSRNGETAVDCLALATLSPAGLRFAVLMSARLGRSDRRAREAERRLASELVHDPLTGLPSRQLLVDRLEQSLSLAQREKSGLAVMVIDVNRFGDFNRQHGRDIGDRLLQEIGLRLRGRLRHSDSLARLENDAFGVLLPTGGTFSGALNAANKLMEALRVPFELGALRLTPTVSIGIAVYPSHATDGPNLLSAPRMPRSKPAAIEAAWWSGVDRRKVRSSVLSRSPAIYVTPSITAN